MSRNRSIAWPGFVALVWIVVATGCGAHGRVRQASPKQSAIPVDTDSIAAQIDASVAAGRERWQASCPVQQVGGLCIIVEQGQEAGICAESAATRLRVVKRDSRLAMQAIGDFGNAIALWGNGDALRYTRGASQDAINQQDKRMIAAVAEAHFFLGEPALETALAHAGPDFAALGGEGSPTSIDRLRRWVGDMGAALRKPERYYIRLGEELQVGAVDRWVAASAARMALLHEYFADALISTPLPGDLANTRYDERSFCSALARLAAPLRAKTAALRKRCQATAVTQRRTLCVGLPLDWDPFSWHSL